MKKTLQTSLVLTVLFLIIAFGLKVYLFQKSFLLIWLIGIAIGFVLYRSGICFSTMYQDIFLFRDFSTLRAVLILIIVSLIGINIIQVYAYLHGQTIPGKFHSVGVHTAAGGFLFGLGMVLAGGCASGTLQRIGEGFLLFWFVLFGMFFGSILGAYHYSWWITNFFSFKPVFMSDVFGWVTGGLISFFALGSIFYATFMVEKRVSTRKRGGKGGRKKIKPPGGSLSLSSVENSEGA